MWCDVNCVFFTCICLMISVVEHLFMYLLGHCMCSLENTSIQVLCPFFFSVWIILFCFVIELLEFLQCVGYYSLIWYAVCKYFWIFHLHIFKLGKIKMAPIYFSLSMILLIFKLIYPNVFQKNWFYKPK